MTGKLVMFVLTICLVCLFGMVCYASDETPGDEEARAEKSNLALGLLAMGAAVAVGSCAIATGIAQSRIGAAGCGTIAERPESMGVIIILVAIPETMVILGFVVAIVILLAL